MNRVQNGIWLSMLTSDDSANISRPKAAPLNSRPRPNLRGIDGFLPRMATQMKAMIGAQPMVASEFTVWNQATGKVQLNIWGSMILSARKVNELPACSKNIQNIMLKKKISSMAMTLSRATGPFLTPSTSSMTDSSTNSADSTICRLFAPAASRKYTTGITNSE